MGRKVTADERERKRLHILEVAAGEFAREGFERANINTISELAGLGKGTVYLYAASKEQLFLDVLREIGAQMRAALTDTLATPPSRDVLERLHAVAEAFAQLAEEHPDFVRLQASALFGVNRRFQHTAADVLRDIANQLARSFAEDQARHMLRRVAPEALALLLLGTLQTFALLPEALGLDIADARTRTDALVDLLWRGLAPEGASVTLVQ